MRSLRQIDKKFAHEKFMCHMKKFTKKKTTILHNNNSCTVITAVRLIKRQSVCQLAAIEIGVKAT